MAEPMSRQDSSLAALADRGRRAQWCAETDIDWSLPVRSPRWLSRRAYAAAISQLYHGEVATIRACRRLADEVEDPAARACLQVQIADERRHARAYETYLQRLGGVAPMDAAVAGAHKRALAWLGDPAGLVVLYHVVLEGEALMLHGDFRRWFRCPLLGAINRRIEVDEARHVAFGRLYLRSRLARTPLHERLEMLRWAEDLWMTCAAATSDRYWGWIPAPRAAKRGKLRRRWAAHAETLIAVGLTGAAEAQAADTPAADRR